MSEFVRTGKEVEIQRAGDFFCAQVNKGVVPKDALSQVRSSYGNFIGDIIEQDFLNSIYSLKITR